MMATVELNGETLEYLKDGNGPPVVLLHGVGACAGLWRGVVDALGGGYTTFAVSLRGHGGSSCNGGLSAAAIADDVAALADKLSLTSFHLVGVSLGAAAALRLAAARPGIVKSLTLSGLGLEPGQALADEIYGIREAVHYLVPDDFAQQVGEALLAPDAPPERLEAMAQSILALTKQRYLQALEALSAAQSGQAAGQVTAPCLVLRGELDELVAEKDANALAGAISGAGQAEIPDAGHLANIDNPAVFAATLGPFLKAAG